MTIGLVVTVVVALCSLHILLISLIAIYRKDVR